MTINKKNIKAFYYLSIQMNGYFKFFETIWNKYYSILPLDPYKFDNYMRVINKIRNNSMDFTNYKITFNLLLEDMSLTIYNYKYKELKEIYDENCEYANDIELNCCYIIKKYIQ